MTVAGLVGALSAWFAIGYAHGASATRTGWTAYPVFVLGMAVVPAAGDVVTFLLAWEVMAIASTVLLLLEHAQRAQVRSAGLWYAVMTHLSFLLLTAGFAVLVAAASTTQFSGIAATTVHGSSAGVAFVLLAGGFATKAGLVPVHVWLPRAHPEAPSHVSAAMSAAMVKMGVYGLLLTSVRLLPQGPRWWAVGLLVVGAGSAVYGILQAAVCSDLKRLLAYSTTENAGLMVAALGVSMVLRAAGNDAVADVALVSSLLLVVSHAAFKSVLFLTAGSVVQATGERDLDRLGGLGPRMPVTAVAAGAAALGAAALPISCGFVAEWVLLQALIHGEPRTDRMVAVALPLTLAVVALTAGLALLTFVKMFGIAFLARPRSTGAAGAHETGGTMRSALIAGSMLVLALGLAPGPLAETLAGTVSARGVDAVRGGGLSLPGIHALLDPAALAAVGVGIAASLVLVTIWLARRRPRRQVDLPWGCGGVRVDPRMQYTATSYAEPLLRVFDDALQPSSDLEVTHAQESRYHVAAMRFHQQVGDRVESRLYQPLGHDAAVGRRHRTASTKRQHPPLPRILVRRARTGLAGGDLVTSATIAFLGFQVVVAFVVTPVLVGVIRTVRARMEGRVGPGVLQPWRDVRKLLAKEPLRATGTGPLMAALPLVLLVTSLMACALVPLVGAMALPLLPDDLFVVVSVLLVGTVAVALLGLESGSAFGGMGSSRHMTIAALVEPTVLVAVYALSVPVGTSTLSAIIQARLDAPASVVSPVSLLALVALVVVVIAETGRLPVDNPSTHLELTMIHEAMTLESAGPDLAWLELGSWLRLTVLLGLIVNLAAPWGIATDASIGATLIGTGAFAAKMTVVGCLLGAVEVFLAKIRLFRVPELLAGSFVLAFLSVTASYLLG